MSISRFSSPLYLSEDISDYNQENFNNSTRLFHALDEFSSDLLNCHEFSSKIYQHSVGLIGDKELLVAYNEYKSKKSINMFKD